MSGVLAIARMGLAAMPGVASVDSSADPLPRLAGLDLFSAAGAPTLAFQISIDGYELIPAADTSATASSGVVDIAVAAPSGNDVAVIVDPFGTAIFGNDLNSTFAQNGNCLYERLTPFGDLPGTAAATGGNFLTELLSLF